MNRKKALSAAAVCGLAAALALGAVFTKPSGKKPKGDSEKGTEETAYEFKIGVTHSEGDADSELAEKGFADALSDLLAGSGENAVFTTASIDAAPGDPAALSAEVSGNITAGCDLLFVTGDAALSAAAGQTKSLPIVAADVMDYPTVLGISPSVWDGKTRTNVTGVSSAPDMEAVLSLLIEATPDLRNVGLLTAEGDAKALLQNRTMEAYLDEAGIPWKEYPLPLNVNPEAAAAAEAAGTPLPTLESMTALAATECSVLYLPADCSLTDSAASIGNITKSLGKPLVAADRTAGASALVCAYESPYAEGYMAGVIAVRILRDGYDPGELDILSADTGFHKLYEKSYAEALGRAAFPKSFSEYSDFFSTYDFSSDVDRKAEIEKNS